MTDQQLIDESITLFAAGHETTANALTFSWHLLSRHPRAFDLLLAELDEVLAGRPPTSRDVDNLPYTRQVLAESMRIFPPVWAIGRQAKEPVRIGGYTLPERTVLLMSQWVVHRDGRWWPDPLRFDPDRWSADPPSRPKYAYFPFGGGVRSCIGEAFAWMEGVLILATLAQHWRPAPCQVERVELLPTITLRPKNGLRMRLHRRPRPLHHRLQSV